MVPKGEERKELTNLHIEQPNLIKQTNSGSGSALVAVSVVRTSDDSEAQSKRRSSDFPG